MNDIEEKLKMFEDKYNPMQMYCRLRELGLEKREAVDTARYYEEMFYKPLIKELKHGS